MRAIDILRKTSEHPPYWNGLQLKQEIVSNMNNVWLIKVCEPRTPLPYSYRVCIEGVRPGPDSSYFNCKGYDEAIRMFMAKCAEVGGNESP